MVDEGVDFAQDSKVGRGADFFFASDLEEEVNNDFNDGSFARTPPPPKDPGANDAPASPSLAKLVTTIPCLLHSSQVLLALPSWHHHTQMVWKLFRGTTLTATLSRRKRKHTVFNLIWALDGVVVKKR